MPSNLQNQNSVWGVTAGLIPFHGPKVLNVPVTLVAGVMQEVDVHEEIANDVMGFIQAVFIDNSTGASPVTLFVTVTQQKIVCPTKSQGVFTVMMVPGASKLQVTGPAGPYVLLFSNMPFAPAVWSAQ